MFFGLKLQYYDEHSKIESNKLTNQTETLQIKPKVCKQANAVIIYKIMLTNV